MADLTQLSNEELMRIAGKGERKLSPRREEVEKRIAERPSPLEAIKKEIRFQQEHPIRTLLTPISAPLAGAKALAVPIGRLESVLASAGLGIQERQPITEVMSDIWKSVKGERRAQLGDIIRTTGAPEPIAALIGMLGLTGTLKATSLLGGLTARKMPKIMNSRWITQQARNAQTVAKNLERSLAGAFKTVRGPVAQVPINPSDMDDILLNSNLDDVILKEIDTLVGKVNNVEKAYAVVDILRKRAGTAVFRAGGTTGKGGMANGKIRI